MARKRMIMIVTANEKDAANTEAQKYDPIGGDKTFSVGLSATGSEPWTHYWCSWLMDSDDLAKMRQFASGKPVTRIILDEDRDDLTVHAILKRFNLKTIPEPQDIEIINIKPRQTKNPIEGRD